MWLLRGDDRAFSTDEVFYKKLVKPYIDAGKPFLIVLNQVDKVEPFREWDVARRKPSIEQKNNIDLKINDVSRFFGYPKSKIIPISANERYNLDTLVDEIVEVLPKEKKLIVLNKIEETFVSKESANKAINGFWESIDEILSNIIPAYSKIKSTVKVIDKLIEVTGVKKVLEKGSDILKSGWEGVKSLSIVTGKQIGRAHV